MQFIHKFASDRYTPCSQEMNTRDSQLHVIVIYTYCEILCIVFEANDFWKWSNYYI